MTLDALEDWRKTHYTEDVTPELDGEEVTLMGWAREIRLHGSLGFIELADRSGNAQVTVLKKDIENAFERVKGLNREDVIAVRGMVKKTDKTKRGVEVLLKEIKILNKAIAQLPLDVSEKTPTDFDKRFDARLLDLRKPRVTAVFQVRDRILTAAREYFESDGFKEIETPKMIATATEGGAALFPISYFDREAFLRQSPQIYKEIMIACFEKVYEIGPVFRAEPSDTPRHLAEITQMDIEMGFADEEDTWKVFDGLVPHIYKEVQEHCKEALELLDVKLEIPKAPLPRVSYDEVLGVLEKAGIKLTWGDDIPPEGEREITKHYKNAVIVFGYPMELKPYYIQARADNPKISYGFDLIMSGLEIASGGRRVHDPEMYVKQLKDKGMNPASFESVVEFFRLGMPPHAGWAIGVDRLAQIMCGLENVREAVLFPRDVKRLTP